MSAPTVILWDIETSHNVVATFRLRDDAPIPHTNILQERYIICAAWKEEDKARLHTVSVLDDAKRFKADPCDDWHVVTTLHEVLSGADVSVAHYGDAFDVKYLATRMAFHGLLPLPPHAQFDTQKVARQKFLFNSNRLDYLGQFLGLGRKKSTEPGLWLRALKGDVKAIRAMVSYNKQDVVLLEKVYQRLKPFASAHLNRQLVGDIGCPRCGSMHTTKQGTHKALTRTYQRYQCQACGGWFRDTRANSTGTPTRVL